MGARRRQFTTSDPSEGVVVSQRRRNGEFAARMLGTFPTGERTPAALRACSAFRSSVVIVPLVARDFHSSRAACLPRNPTSHATPSPPHARTLVVNLL
jgi:hypothetical protein